MDIVVLHARHVQPVQQRQRVLEMHVVVRDAVHHQEAHVGCERGRVGDGGVVVAGGVVLGGVHVAFGVDGVWLRVLDSGGKRGEGKGGLVRRRSRYRKSANQ